MGNGRRGACLLAASIVASTAGAALAGVQAVQSRDLTIVAAAGPAAPSTCTLGAVADTYSDALALNAGSNFGTAVDLHVRSDVLGNKRSFVRFDITSCAIPSGADVTAATLRIFMRTAPSGGASRTLAAHRVTASWGETTLTSNNPPAVAASATASTATGTVSGVTLPWTVLTDVQAFVAGSTANQGWRLSDSVESAAVSTQTVLGSRESATAGERPQLVIGYYP
jgi:hypothetical protein